MMLVESATKNNDHTIQHDDQTRHNEYSVAALNQDIINLRRLCYCLEHRIPTQKNNSDNNDSATTTLMKAKIGGEIKLKRHEIVYLQSKARMSLQKIQEDSSQQQHFIREEYHQVVNDLKNLVERACKKISNITEEEENDGREMNLVDLLLSQSKLLSSEDSGSDNDEVEESGEENHDEKNDEDHGYGDLGLADYDQKDLLHHNQQQQQENHTNDEPEEEEKSPEEILQEELTEMVSQLKQNTLRMNSQLKSQNETLLEDLGNKTSENLHNVTNVAEKTSDYNKKNKSWKSWFGHYGILISVVGTMCGMYVFMKIFPKRNYYGRSRSSYHYDEYYGNSNSNRYNDNNYQSSYSKPNKKKNTTPPPPETKDGMRYGGKHYGILPKTYDGAYTEQLEQEYDPPDFSYDGSWTMTTTTTTTSSSSSSSFDSEDEKKEKGKINDSSSDDVVFSYDATAFKKSHHDQKQDQQEHNNNDDKKQKQKRNSDKSSSSWRHQHSNLQSKSRNSRHTKNLQRARRNKPYEQWWDNPEEEQDIDSEYEYDNDNDYNNNDYSDEQEKEDSQCEAKPIPETHNKNDDDVDSTVKNNCEINEQSDEPKLMGKSSDDLRAIHDVDMEEPGCMAAARALKQENEEDTIKAQVLDHTQNGDNEAQWMKNIKHKVREKEEGQDNNNEREANDDIITGTQQQQQNNNVANEKEEKKNIMPNNLNIDETFQSMLQRAQEWYKNSTQQQQIELKRRDLFYLSAIDFERHPNHETNTFRDILKEFPLLSFVCDKNGWYAIHEAARGRSLETMKELVKHSIDFLVMEEGENMKGDSLEEEEKIRKELTQKYLNLRTNFERGGNVLSWVGDSDSDDELLMYLKENGAIRIKTN